MGEYSDLNILMELVYRVQKLFTLLQKWHRFKLITQFRLQIVGPDIRIGRREERKIFFPSARLFLTCRGSNTMDIYDAASYQYSSYIGE